MSCVTSNTAASIADRIELSDGSGAVSSWHHGVASTMAVGAGHCRDACESLKRTPAICRQLPTPDVPTSVAASVKAAIHEFLNQR